MICLIFMFRYILHWWSVWSLCSDISSIDDLFDLYCLGDKYELRGSRNLIKEVVSSFKINQENWIHILKGIKKHENTFLFEDLCDILGVKVQGIRVYSLEIKIIFSPVFVFIIQHFVWQFTKYRIINNLIFLGFLEVNLNWSSPESYLENFKESEDTDFCFWVENMIQKWSRSRKG